jgi:hypothetical protein
MDVTSAAADDDDGRGPGGNKRKRNGEGGGTSYLHLAVKEREKKKAREWKGGSTDVLILIFARLNPLSLACCSVVCRTWYATPISLVSFSVFHHELGMSRDTDTERERWSCRRTSKAVLGGFVGFSLLHFSGSK